jgi:hypothetical protein
LPRYRLLWRGEELGVDKNILMVLLSLQASRQTCGQAISRELTQPFKSSQALSAAKDSKGALKQAVL